MGDRYWNELPAVIRYLSRRATGDELVWWTPHLKKHYATPPRRRGLVIACGSGWVDRALIDQGIVEQIDAFDISPDCIRACEAERGDRPIRYFVSDFTSFHPDGRYDLIVNHAALHHARRLYGTTARLARFLEPDGVLFNWDYIGPDRNQYARSHVTIMEAVNAALPERFRTPHELRLTVRAFLAGDPTEAVHASEVPAAVAEYFQLVEWKNLCGGLVYQLLWNNINELEKGDQEAQDTISWLLALDEQLTARGLVPPLFAMFIARSRPRPAWSAPFNLWVREPLREAFADLAGGYYPKQLVVDSARYVRRAWQRRKARRSETSIAAPSSSGGPADTGRAG